MLCVYGDVSIDIVFLYIKLTGTILPASAAVYSILSQQYFKERGIIVTNTPKWKIYAITAAALTALYIGTGAAWILPALHT
jgi:hypothetical protein